MEYIDAKQILQTSDGSWFGCEYSINMYRGCNHNCVYCDSRSDCYAIKHFSTVRAKRDALSLLENELAHKRKKGVVALGAMSDCYNTEENTEELTRNTLKLLDRFGFGVSLETKSSLVTRDIDVLCSIASHSPVIVKCSITTPYDSLAKKLEPKASAVNSRWSALQKLSDAGLYTGVLMTPVLPFIEDDSASILQIVDKAAEVGCKCVYAGTSLGVTLRDSQRVYFLDKVEKLFPGMKDKYCQAYGDAYYCMSQNNAALFKTFTDRCRSRNLLYDMEEITADYKRAYSVQQISLFDF